MRVEGKREDAPAYAAAIHLVPIMGGGTNALVQR